MSVESRSQNLAIFARSPMASSQTFVRRHIKHLNDGKTVVICVKDSGKPVLDRPTLLYRRTKLIERARAVLPSASILERVNFARDKKIKSFLDEHQVTHILLEFGYLANDFGLSITQMDRPIYCMFRGNDASGMLRNKRYRALLGQVFGRLNGIIAVSSHLIDNLAQYGFVHPNSIVVPSGVDTKRFTNGPAVEKKLAGRCVCVGRLVAKKTPEILLRAFAQQNAKHDLSLEFIGEGELMEPMKSLATQLGCADRVIFAGHLPHEEVVGRMQRASFYLQHFQTAKNGDTEGMPNVIQEAMACGLPIITTRHGGIPDHIENGINGILVEPGDIEAFSNAIEHLVTSPTKATEIGKMARKYAVENLDFRISHNQLEKFMGLKR